MDEHNKELRYMNKMSKEDFENLFNVALKELEEETAELQKKSAEVAS